MGAPNARKAPPSGAATNDSAVHFRIQWRGLVEDVAPGRRAY